MKTQLDDETQQWLIEQIKLAGYDSLYVFDYELPYWAIDEEGYDPESPSLYLLFVGKGISHKNHSCMGISIKLEDRYPTEGDLFLFTEIGVTEDVEMYKTFLDDPEEDYLHLEVSP